MKVNKEEFLKLYRQGLTDTEISKIVNCTPQNIADLRKKRNLKSNGKVFIKRTKEEVEEMYNTYIQYGLREMQRKFNTTSQTHIFNKYGFKIRNREEFSDKMEADNFNSFNLKFEGYNSIEEAYILGLFIADGNICKNKNTSSIILQKDDDYLLLLIQKLIGRGTISYRQNACILTFHSNIFWERLNKLGVLERKSYIDFNLPIMNNKLFPHFLRGFFDGDGHFALSSKKLFSSTFGFTGTSFSLFTDIKNKLEENGIIIRLDVERNVGDPVKILNEQCVVKTKCYQLRTSNIKNNLLLYEFMYKDKGELYLKRKYERSSIYYNYYKWKQDNTVLNNEITKGSLSA